MYILYINTILKILINHYTNHYKKYIIIIHWHHGTTLSINE